MCCVPSCTQTHWLNFWISVFYVAVESIRTWPKAVGMPPVYSIQRNSFFISLILIELFFRACYCYCFLFTLCGKFVFMSYLLLSLLYCCTLPEVCLVQLLHKFLKLKPVKWNANYSLKTRSPPIKRGTFCNNLLLWQKVDSPSLATIQQ